MASCHRAMVERERSGTQKPTKDAGGSLITPGLATQRECVPTATGRRTLQTAWVSSLHKVAQRPRTLACGATGFCKLSRQLLVPASCERVHQFDRRCDSVWQHQVRAIQAVQKTKEVAQEDFSRTVRPVLFLWQWSQGFLNTSSQLFMKFDNFVSAFKHDLCVPGRFHGKLLALLTMASARKVFNELLRCAEVFSQAEYSTSLLSIGDVGTRKDLYVNVMLYDAKMERSTLSAPNASIAQMFVPAVFKNPRQFFSERHDWTLVSKLWCVL